MTQTDGPIPWRMHHAVLRQAAATPGRSIRGEGTIFVGYVFPDAIDPLRLEAATQRAAVATEALTSTYQVHQGSVWRQRIQAPVVQVVSTRDDDLENSDLPRAVSDLASGHRDFDLTTDVLVRMVMVRGKAAVGVAWLLDHTVCDGVGARSFMGRVIDAYESNASLEPDDGVLRDYHDREADAYQSTRTVEASAKYAQSLGSAVPTLRLVRGDINDTEIVTRTEAVPFEHQFGPEAVARLGEASRSDRSTLFATVVGRLASCLFPLAAERQPFSFITPMQGRLTGHTDTVGNFVNLMPIVVPGEWNKSTGSSQVQAAMARAFGVQAIQFSKIAADHLAPDRRQLVSSRRLFISGLPRETLSIDGAYGTAIPTPLTSALFDLSIWVEMDQNVIDLHALARSAVFTSDPLASLKDLP